MTDQHPIIPPPELVQQWNDEGRKMLYPEYQMHIATRAAQWGADQELGACCDFLDARNASFLRAARRPKPSLKEQANAELDRLIALIPSEGAIAMAEPIRRALEQLDD